MRSPASSQGGSGGWGEEESSALDEWLQQDWHMIPAITLDVGLNLMDFVQKSTQQVR